MLSMVEKLCGKAVINRIKQSTEEYIGVEQCRFRIGRDCVDQIAAMRYICGKYQRKRKDVFPWWAIPV